jgi:hypothetical protein
MGRMRGRPESERRRVISGLYDIKSPLTDAQTTIIRIEHLIAKKDTEDKEGPARSVCDGAQESRPDSGTTEKLSSTLANITIQKAEPTHSIRHEIEKRLERHVGEKTKEVDTHLPGRVVEVQALARASEKGLERGKMAPGR